METVRKDLGEILWVAIPKVAGGALQFGFNIALLRFVGPDSFGTISVCLTGLLLLDAVLGAAIDMGIFRLAPVYRQTDPSYARQIEKAGLAIKPAGAAILAVPLVLFAPQLSRLLFQRPEPDLLYFTFAALLGMLLFRSTQVHFQIERRFAAYGLTDLLHNAVRFGSIALLFAWGTRSAQTVLLMYALARELWRAELGRKAFSELYSVVKWYVITVVVGTIISRMDLFFVSARINVAEAGIYSAAQAFALVPQLLGPYMSAVFSPRVMDLWQKGKLRGTYLRYQGMLIGISAGLFLLAALLLRGGFATWLLPPAFARASDVILLLLPAGLAALVSFPWTIPFLLYTRPKLLLAMDCAAFPVLCAGYSLASESHGATGVAAVTSAYAVLRAALYQVLALRIMLRGPDQSTASPVNLAVESVLKPAGNSA